MTMITSSILPFTILGLVLIGIAICQRYNILCALIGFIALSIVIFYTHSASYYWHIMAHQAGLAANIFLLFLSFSVITIYLEDSGALSLILQRLPQGISGHMLLLLLTFLLSTVIDNIAAVLIAGSIAHSRFRDRLHVLFIAALIVCANAGGAGSIIGDTTTTLLWLSGISQHTLWPAFIGSIITTVLFAVIASYAQERHHSADTTPSQHSYSVSWSVISTIVLNLAIPVLITIYCNQHRLIDTQNVPIFGLCLIAGLGITMAIHRPRRYPPCRKIAGEAFFVVLLILIASLVPVQQLPTPTTGSTYGIGLLSALFDNIPLTALAISQQNYNWPLLAFAVGVGGSILWFGSSAGVALTANHRFARELKYWWPVIPVMLLVYTVGFFSIAALS